MTHVMTHAVMTLGPYQLMSELSVTLTMEVTSEGYLYQGLLVTSHVELKSYQVSINCISPHSVCVRRRY